MSYARDFYSINRLATELQRDPVTIGKALASHPGDGIKSGNKVYFLTTALQAMGAWKKGGADGESLDKDYERARKDKESADRLAMQNAVTRGELLDGRVVDQAIITLLTESKTRLLGVGRQIAEYAIHAESVGELDQIITDGIRDALDILSTFSPGDLRSSYPEESADVGEDVEDPAPPHNQRVGRPRKTPQPRGQRRTRTVADE